MVEFSDKSATFSFNIETKNAALEDTEARLVVETKTGNRLYPVQISIDGRAYLEFTPSNLLEEGKVYLEVINKDFYSRPWSDSYIYEGRELSSVEKYYQKGLQKLKVTALNEARKEKHINILLEHTAKRYKLDAKEVLKLKRNTSNLL
jgi:hypothetical protein